MKYYYLHITIRNNLFEVILTDVILTNYITYCFTSTQFSHPHYFNDGHLYPCDLQKSEFVMCFISIVGLLELWDIIYHTCYTKDSILSHWMIALSLLEGVVLGYRLKNTIICYVYLKIRAIIRVGYIHIDRIRVTKDIEQTDILVLHYFT